MTHGQLLILGLFWFLPIFLLRFLLRYAAKRRMIDKQYAEGDLIWVIPAINIVLVAMVVVLILSKTVKIPESKFIKWLTNNDL
jgi:putative copper export protein